MTAYRPVEVLMFPAQRYFPHAARHEIVACLCMVDAMDGPVEFDQTWLCTN